MDDESKHGIFHCSGPCNQGRDQCPTPWACEREELGPSAMREIIEDTLMATAIVAAIFAILWLVI